MFRYLHYRKWKERAQSFSQRWFWLRCWTLILSRQGWGQYFQVIDTNLSCRQFHQFDRTVIGRFIPNMIKSDNMFAAIRITNTHTNIIYNIILIIIKIIKFLIYDYKMDSLIFVTNINVITWSESISPI